MPRKRIEIKETPYVFPVLVGWEIMKDPVDLVGLVPLRRIALQVVNTMI